MSVKIFSADSLSRARRSRVDGGSPGIKRYTKTCLSRAARRDASNQIVKEVQMLASSEALQHMSAAELESYADWLLEDSNETCTAADTDLDTEMLLESFEEGELPATLVGSLPDWMLNKLEAAKGDAFELLSLFEAKSASPKAVFLTDDEAAFA